MIQHGLSAATNDEKDLKIFFLKNYIEIKLITIEE
jgi:hypothetical protein